jgi:hypothetical protein
VSLQNLLDIRDFAVGFAIVLRDPNDGIKSYLRNIEIIGQLAGVITENKDRVRPKAFLSHISNKGLVKIRFS